jgi:hypothetical protein
VIAVPAAVSKEWAAVIPWMEAQLVEHVPMPVSLDHLGCRARLGYSPEIAKSPTCAAEHGPELRSQTVRADETHAPDLGPGQDNLDINILGPASAREVLARRDTAEGGGVSMPHDAGNGRRLQDLVGGFERRMAREKRVSTLRDRKRKHAEIRA